MAEDLEELLFQPKPSLPKLQEQLEEFLLSVLDLLLFQQGFELIYHPSNKRNHKKLHKLK